MHYILEKKKSMKERERERERERKKKKIQKIKMVKSHFPVD